MKTYRVYAEVPWGVETYLVAAPNHLAAVARVEKDGQPRGEQQPVALAWETIERENQ